MRVLTWNLQGESGISEERLSAQLQFLDDYTQEIDLCFLQAVQYEQTSDGWGGHLGALLAHFADRGFDVVHTADWAHELRDATVQPHTDITAPHNRCNLTVSRAPLTRTPLGLRNHGDRKPRNLNYYYNHFPEKLLVTTLDHPDTQSVECWNVGVINGANWGEEKLNMLETIYARIHLQTQKTDRAVVLGGDFNAPKRETSEGKIIPHGTNAGQYTQYPFYGDPHHLRDTTADLVPYRFDQRWQRAEARIFDPNTGDWGLRDAYWAATESPQAASTDDHTHIVHTATPSHKRLDHILASTDFAVERCEVWNGIDTPVDGFEASDHAPVTATLTESP